MFPPNHTSQVSAQPLTPKEYLRAAYMPISAEKEFWDMEAEDTDKILSVHNFLVNSGLPQEQKIEMYNKFLCRSLFELICICTHFKEFDKAQKYLYLALTKSLLRSDKNICSKCQSQKCLSVCPKKNISSFQTQDGEYVIKINRQTCEYCFRCMKHCPVVNEK